MVGLVATVAVGCGGGARAANRAGHPAPAGSTIPAPVVPIHFTVEAAGDILIHSPIWQEAQALGGGRRYRFAPIFRYLRPVLKAVDLPICHMETPMSPRAPMGYPIFNTPTALAPAIAATGWKVCSTAATHSLDQGQFGVDETLRALDRAGVAHAGTARSPAEERRITLFDVRGVRVAFLAYTTITNGIPSPRPWSVARARVPRILADARRARRLGARAVLVNIHWGDENVTAPSAQQVGLADALTRSRDITAVFGQHVHVVQPIRRMHGKLVVFGEGNLVSNQTSACCPAASQDGILSLLHFVADARGVRLQSVGYVPIWVRHPDFSVLPVGFALRHRLADRSELVASYRRTVATIGRGPGFGPVPARLP